MTKRISSIKTSTTRTAKTKLSAVASSSASFIQQLALPPFKANTVKAVSDVPFNLIKGLALNKFEGQRADEKRVHRAKYLHQKLEQAQLVFSAVRYREDDGQFALKLIDGYTRVQAVHQNLASVDPGVGTVLIVHDCVSKDQVFNTYMAYDSPLSVKKAKDRVDEGMRIQFNDVFVLKSKMISSAPICTAMRHINCGRWSKVANQARMVAEFGDSLLVLDNLNLPVNKSRMCSPLFAAMLYAVHYTQGEFQEIGKEYAKAMMQFTLADIPAESLSGGILRDCYFDFSNTLERYGKKPTGAPEIEAEIRRLVKGFGEYFEARLPEMRKRCKVKVTDVADKDQILDKIREACQRYAA